MHLAILLLAQCFATGSVRADGVQDGMGSLPGVDLEYPPGLKPMQSSTSRGLLQQQAAYFRDIDPCKDLQDILTTTPTPKSQLGNFTELPTAKLLRQCSSSSSYFMLETADVADVFIQPTPLVKLVSLEPRAPTVWPAEEAAAPRFVPGSVNMIDCHDQVLDLRNWPSMDPPEDSILIFFNCRLLVPDLGTSALSEAASYPRSNPKIFPELSASVGYGAFHMLNCTTWCWTAKDIEEVYASPSPEAAEVYAVAAEESSSVGTTLVWAICIGGIVLLFGAVATIWVCCGRPCCCHRAQHHRTAQHAQHDNRSLRGDFSFTMASDKSESVAPAALHNDIVTEASSRLSVPPPNRNPHHPSEAYPKTITIASERQLEDFSHSLSTPPGGLRRHNLTSTSTAHESDPVNRSMRPSAALHSTSTTGTAPMSFHAFYVAQVSPTGSSHYHSASDKSSRISSCSSRPSLPVSPAASPTLGPTRASDPVVSATDSHARNVAAGFATGAAPGSSRAGAVGQAAAVAQQATTMEGVVATGGVASLAPAADAPTARACAPAADAPRQEREEYLQGQLDSLSGKTVCKTLSVLSGSHNRLHGGQAVVQIVQDNNSSEKYAIKFFLSTEAFEQEKMLYKDRNQPLGKFLPQLHSIRQGTKRGLRDAHGALMPPCIIMEKGEALDVWIDSSGDRIDLFTGLQVLAHIAERLKHLHAAGYVHRDIKPGNIMFLPRTKRWTLIDFGCAARTGTHPCNGFSLFYAAPEVLRAYFSGEDGLVATEALDAWSLGILAIELFTGYAVISRFTPRNAVAKMILGDITAPWEDPNTSRSLLKPLGIFKPAVMALLARDPAQRSTIDEFHRACLHALSNSTVAGT